MQVKINTTKPNNIEVSLSNTDKVKVHRLVMAESNAEVEPPSLDAVVVVVAAAAVAVVVAVPVQEEEVPTVDPLVDFLPRPLLPLPRPCPAPWW